MNGLTLAGGRLRGRRFARLRLWLHWLGLGLHRLRLRWHGLGLGWHSLRLKRLFHW